MRPCPSRVSPEADVSRSCDDKYAELEATVLLMLHRLKASDNFSRHSSLSLSLPLSFF